MRFYLSPIEGITTYIYRNAYYHYFGGFDKYFTSFISSKKMNCADEFLMITNKLAEYGYKTVNLNLGFP